jgi:hypothetical protein
MATRQPDWPSAGGRGPHGRAAASIVRHGGGDGGGGVVAIVMAVSKMGVSLTLSAYLDAGAFETRPPVVVGPAHHR